MSQHFMTVCVVCVLCAAHTHCSAHVTDSLSSSASKQQQQQQLSALTTLHTNDNSSSTNNNSKTNNNNNNNSNKTNLLKHNDNMTNSADIFIVKLLTMERSNHQKSTHTLYLDDTYKMGNYFNSNIINQENSNNVNNKRKMLWKKFAHFNKIKFKNNKNNGTVIEETIQNDDINNNYNIHNVRNTEENDQLLQERLDFNRNNINYNNDNNNYNNNIINDNDNHHHHNHDKKYNNSKVETHRRKKRHVNYNEEKYYLKKIFEQYGDGNSLTMDGFEIMLKKLGLVELIANIEISNFKPTALDTSPTDGLQSQSSPKTINSNNKNDNNNNHHHNLKCVSKSELLENLSPDMNLLASTKNHTILPEWLFERLCPVLLYHVSSNSSLERNGCISLPDGSYDDITKINDEYSYTENTRNMFQVWIYSTISIVVISLCGLLGVAVIPVMGKAYYYQLLQFLVALAIGTLCGDALIHLLPHAMMAPHSHDHSDHNQVVDDEDIHNLNMWKGVVAMMGLILFFFTEKALSMITEWHKYRQRKNKLPTKVRVMREVEGVKSNTVGEKLCKHKYSSYPYCYGEITTNSAMSMKNTGGSGETESSTGNRTSTIISTEIHDNNQDNNELNYSDKDHLPTIEESKPLTNSNSCHLPIPELIKNELDLNVHHHDWMVDEHITNDKKSDNNIDDDRQDDRESYTVIIREHENKHHGHTHSHGHVHAAPESMSSVAWMVIMGDGLHNFTDGMAIGAAFAANIAGGFSTAIAVFCHELPHELGDFAVLLKAGMSAKQAVFYNLLSSVLCLFGMIFGVLLGTTPATTSWVFAAAAGMFIYIALVDMIPELSSGHAEESGSHWQCVLQALGLITGLGIMLIIALYEHDLKNIFTD